jgi:hypothetical protein
LEKLLEDLDQKDGEGFTRAVMRVSALKEELAKGSMVDCEVLDRELLQISSDLVKDLQNQLQRDELKALKAECARELRVYRKHVSKDVMGQLKGKQLEKKLFEHFELPEFGLLGFGS